MSHVEVDVRLITLLVMTSVMRMWYSLITPLMSLEGGGDHVRLIEVELTGRTWTLCGGLEGAIVCDLSNK